MQKHKTDNLTKAKLTGQAALEYAEVAGCMLHKHADPTEPARGGLTLDEAREVAKEDPSLIWVEVTRQQAMSTLVELDVARWGEWERDASRLQNYRLSLALLLNSIAVYDVCDVREALREAAGTMFSGDDIDELKHGG